MNVRWSAVITGFIVDYLLSTLMVAFTTADFLVAPDLSRPGDLLLLCLLVLSTGVGGYVAGRLAQTDRTINGLLVAIVGILIGQLLGPPAPRAIIVASAVSCFVAAFGGFLSRYPPLRQPRSSNQR
jgi:hypothetical protein